MRILLVQPSEFFSDEVTTAYKTHGRFKILKRSGSFLQRIICLPPMGLMYVATPLKRAGHEVRILDAYTLQLTNGEILQEAIAFQPDLVGITFYSLYCHQVYELSERLKQVLNVQIVVGGPHPTALPEKVLREFPNVDYLLAGWCDFSIVPFVDFLAEKVSHNAVPGLYYRQNGSIANNPLKSLPEDIDTIPIPDRDILKEMYDRHLYFNILSTRKNMDAITTSRNCPYSCKFCFNLTGHKYLIHSPERVIEEMRHLVNRGVNAIEIMDDNFTVNRKRLDRIIDVIINEGFNVEFRIRCRVDSVDEVLIKRLKKAGIRAISYGMESGSDRMLKLMNKNTTSTQIERACRITKQAGIFCTGNWIAGFPGETKKDLQQTFDLIHRILPTTFNLGFLVPLPGTPVYTEAIENNTLVGEWNPHESKIPFVQTEEWKEYPDFDSRCVALNKAMRRLRMNPRYLWQVVVVVLRQKNWRLFKFGFKFLLTRSSKFFRVH